MPKFSLHCSRFGPLRLERVESVPNIAMRQPQISTLAMRARMADGFHMSTIAPIPIIYVIITTEEPDPRLSPPPDWQNPFNPDGTRKYPERDVFKAYDYRSWSTRSDENGQPLTDKDGNLLPLQYRWGRAVRWLPQGTWERQEFMPSPTGGVWVKTGTKIVGKDGLSYFALNAPWDGEVSARQVFEERLVSTGE